ncbi:NAD(P)-binding protein [Clavulina sp. PMI_390]|nr:NAD(P)-binding protein [Clavulina sp. PMI_390]
MSNQKILAIIGATGAQGVPIVNHLLEAHTPEGSPWKVRILTRNPQHRRVKELEALGAEVVQGSFTNMEDVERLFDGAYGAFMNLDSFTVGAMRELHLSFRIWEVAQLKSVKHFVFSSLDYAFKLGKSNAYSADHYNAKGRFADYLKSQPSASITSGAGTTWTVFTTGPYYDLLRLNLGPVNVRDDGTHVFALPVRADSRIPFQSREDIGWWVRYIFDHPEETTGKEIGHVSGWVTIPQVAETFTRVTGEEATFFEIPMDEYFQYFTGPFPVARDEPLELTQSWEDLFRGALALWRDNIIQRDEGWLNSIHRQQTLEEWMREVDYQGISLVPSLKALEDGKLPLGVNFEKAKAL